MSRSYIPEKAQDRLFAIILKRTDNLECADCSAKGPRWVSLDFGVFICMNCAGAHRTLGPSVTRVRSTKLDGWYQEDLDLMESIGNAAANSFWEFNKASNKPALNSSLEQLIRFVQDKYVKRLYTPSDALHPKQHYLLIRKTVHPFYFQQQPTQPQAQPTQQLGDLLDMHEDEFQDFAKAEVNPLTQDNISHQADQGSQAVFSDRKLSPQPKNDLPDNNHHNNHTVSFPSLDILHLYQQQSGQLHQQNSNQQGSSNQPIQKNKYAYLQNMNHHSQHMYHQPNVYQQYPVQNYGLISQQQQQQQQQQYNQQQQQYSQQQYNQQQYSQQQQPQQQQQYNQQQPLNIMQLYQQQQPYSPHSLNQ